jgi:hypothetical protein
MHRVRTRSCGASLDINATQRDQSAQQLADRRRDRSFARRVPLRLTKADTWNRGGRVGRAPKAMGREATQFEVDQASAAAKKSFLHLVVATPERRQSCVLSVPSGGRALGRLTSNRLGSNLYRPTLTESLGPRRIAATLGGRDMIQGAKFGHNAALDNLARTFSSAA